MATDNSLQTKVGACALCDATCGIEVDLDAGGRVAAIRGDKADPFSQGHLCPKAFAHKDLLEDERRLTAPMRRRGGGDGWEEVPWDSALEDAARRLAEIQQRHGRDAVAIYLGTPVFQSLDTTVQAYTLAGLLRSRNSYSANSVDALPRALASKLVFGSQAVVPVPDLDNVQYLLIIGANPVVSNGSAMTAPGVRKRLKAIRRRGGEVVVIDPRRSETAKVAGRHHFIRPGADALLLLSLINTIFHEDLARPGRLEPHLQGVGQLRQAAAPWTPARAAPLVGMTPEEIQRVARELCAQERAACYGRMGTCTQEFGTLATCLMDAVNVLAGNVDRPGGAMFPTPAVDLAGIAGWTGQTGSFDRWRSRVDDLPEFNGELPLAAMAGEIETPGEQQIRALICVAGNPVLSAPNGRRLERALCGLEYILSVDPYINETSRHAHQVLPPHLGLEREFYPALPMGLAVRNTAKVVPRLVEPHPGTRSDGEILHGLGRALLVHGSLPGRAMAGILGGVMPPGSDRLLRLALRAGPHGGGLLGRGGLTPKHLEEEIHGIDLGPLEPRLPGLLGQGSRIDLAPGEMLADLPRLEQRFGAPDAAPPAPAEMGCFSLISHRRLRALNTWMNHCPSLTGGRDPWALEMNPADALALGVKEGEQVEVRGCAGSLHVPVKITADIMSGVVSLPFGLGRASVNDLTDDKLLDRLSGCACFFGVPVEVARG